MKAQTLWRSSLLIAALIPAGVVAACSAEVGGSKGFPTGTSGGGTGGGGTANNGAGSGNGGGTSSGASGGNASTTPTAAPTTAALPTAQVAESAGILQMRRLTYGEYDNALNVLIGDTTRPAEDPSHPWAADSQNTNGFASPNSVADQQVSNFYQAVDALVETAITAGKLPIPAGCATPTTTAETSCATQFITTFGQQVYRRPVSTAEQTDLMTLFTQVRSMYGQSFTEALGSVAKGMLNSPNFLYHWEIGPTAPKVGADGLVPLTSWQIASRLAESLWESIPDATLMTAAQNGQLSTPAQVAAQATRMIADPRASAALLDLYEQWILSVGTRPENLGGLAPTSNLTQPAIDALPTSLSQFLASVYSTGDGTLNTLMTANYAYVNHDLAVLYGVTGPAASATGLTKVTLDATQRAGGLFTQIPFLAQFASGVVDNPIFRGLSIYTKLLCGSASPPNVQVPSVNFVAQTTTRASYEVHANQKCAQGCHNLFDPPGFAFENYDGIGQWRTLDNGQPVDSTGSFTSPAGNMFTFQNATDLTKQLAASSETQQCLDRTWLRYMFGRLESTADTGSMQIAYAQGAKTTGFSMTNMLTALVSSKAYMYRAPSPGENL
jgi:hypothetical protein